jgi:hypothetical protein
VLAEDELPDERRRSPRLSVEVAARQRAGYLTLDGVIRDASGGGVFLATQLLIEVGERGTLLIDDLEIPVQVVWLRGNAHDSGPGMGLLFEQADDLLARVIAKLEG